MKLKKTDRIVIGVLIFVVLAGIIGIVLAVNLIGQNNEKDRAKRKAEANNTTNEIEVSNTVDPNSTPEQQIQQLVNSMPEALTNKEKEDAIKSIRIRYAYGYDVDLADQMKFIDVLNFYCVGDDLQALKELIVKNQLEVNESTISSGKASYYNTQVIINDEKTLYFSDKNAAYRHDNRTTYVTLSDELLTKLGEVVNKEASQYITAVNEEGVKSIVITKKNNTSVTITDTEDIKNICTLSSCVELKSGVVDLSQEEAVYTVDFNNGVKMQVNKAGATGYMEDSNGKKQVKFMFNGETGLDSIFKKYAK